MRRALILLLLLWGMDAIGPLGVAAPTSQALLTFGFLILAAYTVGEIARDAKLPMLVGYMLAGVIFGPSALDIVQRGSIERVSALNDLAISLIALLAGAELRLDILRSDGIRYAKVLFVEISLSFIACALTVVALRSFIPGMAGATMAATIVFALLLASIIVAHSPAATLGILAETKATGPVAQSALGVVLLSDVVLIFLFTFVASTSRLILPVTGSGSPGLWSLLWEVGGAVVVGGAIGGAVALYLRFTERDLLLFGLIIALLGAEIARLAHVEVLLTLLTVGFVSANFSPAERGAVLRHSVERSSAPFFVVFFALAGASIPLVEVWDALLIVAPLIVVRGVAIWAGTAIGVRWAGIPAPEGKRLWMALIAQAGVAIGFANIAAAVYPEMGNSMRTLAMAVIAVNQLVGPVLFRRALNFSVAPELPVDRPPGYAS